MEEDLAAYVTKMLSSGNLTQQQSGQAAGLLYVSNNIGRIADRCEEIAGVHEKITAGRKIILRDGNRRAAGLYRDLKKAV